MNADQKKRFIEAAREAECDEDEDRFKVALKEIAKAPPQHAEKPKRKKRKPSR